MKKMSVKRSFLEVTYLAILLFEFVLSFGQCVCLDQLSNQVPNVTICFPKSNQSTFCKIKPRRRTVHDLGYNQFFHGWADVQGQGAANDYCRFIGYMHELQLSCALGGEYDEYDDRNYMSSLSFPVGLNKTWYMKDEDGDGRDDYCRCLEFKGRYVIMCTKAGPRGFYGSDAQGEETLTFIASGTDCSKTTLRPEFGRPFND